MSSKLSFAGRAAIVTGAGGGLGRAYALELARRGASIIVNDPGGKVDGRAAGSEGGRPAYDVAKYINENGGKAVANYESVCADGKSIVEHALKEFGRVDVLVNNAGILRDKSFHKMTPEDWALVLDIHLNGTFQLSHAVWPHMMNAKFGRIINVGSGAGLYGNFGQANYSSAKMGILGMTNTLAVEGAKHNIHVNCVVPVAGSRMTDGLLPPNILEILDPKHVANFVAMLAHDSCKENGSCYEVGGGWYSKVRIQRSGGVKLGDKDNYASAEDIAAHLHEINNFENPTYPNMPGDIIKHIISTPVKGSAPTPAPAAAPAAPAAAAATTSSAPNVPFISDKFFGSLKKMLEVDTTKATELSANVRAPIQFEITGPSGAKKVWLLDAKSKPPTLSLASASSLPADWKPYTTIQMSDESFNSLVTGKLSPEFAYLRGALKVEGSMGVALRIKQLITLIK